MAASDIVEALLCASFALPPLLIDETPEPGRASVFCVVGQALETRLWQTCAGRRDARVRRLDEGDASAHSSILSMDYSSSTDTARHTTHRTRPALDNKLTNAAHQPASAFVSKPALAMYSSSFRISMALADAFKLRVLLLPLAPEPPCVPSQLPAVLAAR